MTTKDLPSPPQLLDDDGTASIATALLMSHHGLRRDLARFAAALGRVSAGDGSRVPALKEEWKNYRNVLHGHHEAEDQRMFPFMRQQHPELAAVFEQLTADHRRIDPLLEQADAAFAELDRRPAPAAALVAELSALLDAHLALEEPNVAPLLRAAREFPPPASEEELTMYAEGFAWSSHGIAGEVLDQVYKLLPPALLERLGPARAAYEARCARAWGATPAGASRTARPDWLAQ